MRIYEKGIVHIRTWEGIQYMNATTRPGAPKGLPRHLCCGPSRLSCSQRHQAEQQAAATQKSRGAWVWVYCSLQISLYFWFFFARSCWPFEMRDLYPHLGSVLFSFWGPVFSSGVVIFVSVRRDLFWKLISFFISAFFVAPALALRSLSFANLFLRLSWTCGAYIFCFGSCVFALIGPLASWSSDVFWLARCSRRRLLRASAFAAFCFALSWQWSTRVSFASCGRVPRQPFLLSCTAFLLRLSVLWLPGNRRTIVNLTQLCLGAPTLLVSSSGIPAPFKRSQAAISALHASTASREHWSCSAWPSMEMFVFCRILALSGPWRAPASLWRGSWGIQAAGGSRPIALGCCLAVCFKSFL